MTKRIPSAAAIGSLFEKARGSHVNSVKYLIDCGGALTAAKEAIPRGDWVFWLKDHQAQLGFTEDTAQRMMRAAKLSKNHASVVLSDEEAVKISRVIWNHTNEQVPMLEDQTSPPIKRFRKMLEWCRIKSRAEVIAELDREEVPLFTEMASEMAAWLLAYTKEASRP
jgi:hypothetical protein